MRCCDHQPALANGWSSASRRRSRSSWIIRVFTESPSAAHVGYGFDGSRPDAQRVLNLNYSLPNGRRIFKSERISKWCFCLGWLETQAGLRMGERNTVRSASPPVQWARPDGRRRRSSALKSSHSELHGFHLHLLVSTTHPHLRSRRRQGRPGNAAKNSVLIRREQHRSRDSKAVN